MYMYYVLHKLDCWVGTYLGCGVHSGRLCMEPRTGVSVPWFFLLVLFWELG
jgi:hypothetical protein